MGEELRMENILIGLEILLFVVCVVLHSTSDKKNKP
jgi:hypothetical protein